MGGGVSRWWRGFPCAFFSNEISHPPPSKTISCSALNATANSPQASRDKQQPNTSADKNLCAICLEPLGGSDGTTDCGGGNKPTVFTAQCMHSFHFPCITSNVRHGNVTCPICRSRWSQLPRNLKAAQMPRHSDPVLRILDDSIATFRVNRRSFLRTTRYNDDDPIEPTSMIEPAHSSLRFSLIITPMLTSCHEPSVQQMRTYLSVRLAPQPATDLVLVASPNGPHTRLLKQSMALVVFSLRAVDRLAIVTYSTSATRALPLRRMSSHGKRMALQVIDHLSYTGGADLVEGLQKGAKIIEDRMHCNPRACILHLSDSPTRRYATEQLISIPVHYFHVGFGSGLSSGFVMHEFEEFLARLLGGTVRDIQLRIGEQTGLVMRLGELTGGEERRIPLDSTDGCGFIMVGYRYNEGGRGDEVRSGEVAVGAGEKSGSDGGGCRERERERDLSIVGRRSCGERWNYLDPFMARRWAKHLHACKA